MFSTQHHILINSLVLSHLANGKKIIQLLTIKEENTGQLFRDQMQALQHLKWKNPEK